jgi:MinD superfamily P-loop ATPase
MDNTWALPHISDERCSLCGSCIQACANEVLVLGAKQPVVTDLAACDCCGVCEEVCPEDAIDCAFEIVWDEPQDRSESSQEQGRAGDLDQ